MNKPKTMYSKRYLKVPKPINAWQLTKEFIDAYSDANVGFLGVKNPGEPSYHIDPPKLTINFLDLNDPSNCEISFDTPEGKLTCHGNDWLIEGLCNEFYFIRNDIFKKTYQDYTLTPQPITTEEKLQ